MAYHDRSDGGLLATVCEMAFASRCGLAMRLDALDADSLAVLFNEELGAVIQTRRRDRRPVLAAFEHADLSALCHLIGYPAAGNNIEFTFKGNAIFKKPRSECHQLWSQTTWHMQRMRDNPVCAGQEYARIADTTEPGLFCHINFDHGPHTGGTVPAGPRISVGTRPKIAILREQGVNGQMEMAAAFDCGGFDAVDVTMTDLLDGLRLDGYQGLAACGGFSFGDVLGAGQGWGKSILFNPRLKVGFEKFFNRSDTFSLGVCNGCQMMSSIKHLIPGAAHWPGFVRNHSEQYESRLVMVEITSDKSVLFHGMAGAKFPVAVAHGEGRVKFDHAASAQMLGRQKQSCLRFVDNRGAAAQDYPHNPNGSEGGLTGFTSDDGRSTIMMPHPERVFRTVSNSWHPDHWGEYSPWIKIFHNARSWVD